MNSLNKVQLIGNLTADPEVKETPSGQKVATFSVATSRQWKDAAGMKQEASDFHTVVVWGKLAEICEQYLTKGKKVYIEGRLQTRSWEDQSGTKRYKTEVVAENLIMLSGGSGSRGDDSDASLPDAAPADRAKPSRTTKAKPEETINIEDIPF